jgi:hypothetical protein
MPLLKKEIITLHLFLPQKKGFIKMCNYSSDTLRQQTVATKLASRIAQQQKTTKII